MVSLLTAADFVVIPHLKVNKLALLALKTAMASEQIYLLHLKEVFVVASKLESAFKAITA